MNFQWKILEVTVNNDVITHAKYYCKLTNGEIFVDTEGNAYGDLSFGIPYKDITEKNIIDTVKKLYIQDDVNLIELNLQKQLENVQKEPVLPPWHVETFKVEV
jgi:hypothetical protein